MTIPVEFVVEGRPSSVNASSKKKAHWKSTVNAAAHDALLAAGIGGKASTKKVVFKCVFFPPNRQYSDVDNGLKYTIDGLAPPILENDNQVMRVICERFLPGPGSTLLASKSFAGAVLHAYLVATGGNNIHTTAVKVEEYLNDPGANW